MDLSDILDRLAEDPKASIDLAEAALWIARDEYPRLDIEAYLSQLDGLAHEGRRYLGRTLESKVAGLSLFLFREMGFRGNHEHYYDPRNSYLNDVMDRLTGIPISLSLVAMAVGRRLGMHILGVALPGHFVAMAIEDKRRVVFDPYHGGVCLTAADCERLVRQAAGVEMQVNVAELEPASSAAVVTRILNNLKGCYLRRGDFPRAIRVIQRLRQVAPQDLVQLRDLGACWMQMGRPGRAIDHLELYLQLTPVGEDRETVVKLLNQARSEIAQWN